MASIYQDNSLSIGRTPLVKLNRIPNGGRARILAKLEGRNPSYSVKCRIGAAMIWDAEKKGWGRHAQQVLPLPAKGECETK